MDKIVVIDYNISKSDEISLTHELNRVRAEVGVEFPASIFREEAKLFQDGEGIFTPCYRVTQQVRCTLLGNTTKQKQKENRMPKSAFYTLIWSSSSQAYELYKSPQDEALDLNVESPNWLVWLSQITSFAFHGRHGSYTARKERKQRGDSYWYAYARVEGKLTKRYLGRSIDLSFARLELAAQELWCGSQYALLKGEHIETSAISKSGHGPGLLDSDTVRTQSHFVDLQGNSPASRKTTTALSRLPTDPLFATKLRVPRLPTQLVLRPRLIQQLQNGLERVLILVSAPAGFGKSTLLADWLTSSALPAAWLSLESQDNDLARFLSYLIAALQTYDPHLGKNAQALLHLLHPSSLEVVLTSLLNDLQASRTRDQEHVVLVLDDYHVITNEAIHHALSLLLDHLPPQMHLVLSAREDPPLPLARLRVRGAMLELRAADLQFTQEETTIYLMETMDLPLSVEQNALLQVRTEGWITGLQLAAHSLQGHKDSTSFITAFSGNNRYVMDYLLEEVLNRQPADVQDFLIQTCILDRLCAPLCDAVRGQGDSQAMLDFLERANLFLVALDDERQWYRYHHLFAQVLRQRLQQVSPTLLPILHQRASHWYEEHGLFTEGVAHALAAPAFTDAARLIEQCAGVFILGGQLQTFGEWLQALPEHLILARPSLGFLHAITLMYTNHPEAASTRLQAIEQEHDLREDNIRNAHERILLGQLAACRSLLALLSGDLERCVNLAYLALELLPTTKTALLTQILRAGAILCAAHAYLVSGDVRPGSEHALMELIIDARAWNYRPLILKGLILLARLHVLQGRLHQTAAIYEEVIQVVGGAEKLRVLPDSSAYYFGLGDLLREWNELDAAEQHLAWGMNLLKEALSVDADKVWMGYATLARLEQARGRHNQALATLDAFLQLAQQRYIAPELMSQATAMRAHLMLAQGNLQAALHWLNGSDLSANTPLNYLREREYLIMARVRIAGVRSSPTEAYLSDVMALLERLLTDAEANRRMHSVLEILVLRALALDVQGNRTAALSVLERALELAEPEGYVRLFLDEGRPMVSLLRRVQRQGLAPGYVAKLLALAREPRITEVHPHATNSSALVEQFTAREQEVLQLMLHGASNHEIARELIVSVNTVKKHVLNICSKLNVQSRTQAIAKARKLHLL
jgi:LuxR family maltose regulon positive regulatory protein